MIRSYEEIMDAVKTRLSDDTSDEALAFIEDISDTLKSGNSNEAEELKKKLEENDKMWRKKYMDRFFNNDIDKEIEKETVNNNLTDEPDVPDGPQTFEELFETQK